MRDKKDTFLNKLVRISLRSDWENYSFKVWWNIVFLVIHIPTQVTCAFIDGMQTPVTTETVAISVTHCAIILVWRTLNFGKLPYEQEASRDNRMNKSKIQLALGAHQRTGIVIHENSHQHHQPWAWYYHPARIHQMFLWWMKTIVPQHQFLRYHHNSDIILSTMANAVKQAYFWIAGMFFAKVGSFVHVIYPPADLHC